MHSKDFCIRRWPGANLQYTVCTSMQCLNIVFIIRYISDTDGQSYVSLARPCLKNRTLQKSCFDCVQSLILYLELDSTFVYHHKLITVKQRRYSCANC